MPDITTDIVIESPAFDGDGSPQSLGHAKGRLATRPVTVTPAPASGDPFQSRIRAGGRSKASGFLRVIHHVAIGESYVS